MTRAALSTLLGVLALSTLAPRSIAQRPAPTPTPAAAQAEPAPIRVDVNEVMVPVTVTDPKGKFVTNLKQPDFHIYDNGREQAIRYFSAERKQPVVVGFLLDLSSASTIQWKDYREAAIDLVLTLVPGDKTHAGYLIPYNQQSDVAVNTTNDPEPIIDKLRALKTGGGSAIFDALYSAITNRKLVQGEPYQPRRIIVVIGDGHDNASSKSLDEILELAQRFQVTIFGISTTSYGFGSDGEKNLEKLCEQTGGRVWYPLQNVYKDVSGYLQVPQDAGNFAYTVGSGGYASSKASSFFRAIADLVGEIETQYILRFIPDQPAYQAKSHDLRVKVELPDVRVRAREEYFPYNPDLAVPDQAK